MDGEDRIEGLGQGGMREKKQKGIVALGKKEEQEWEEEGRRDDI